MELKQIITILKKDWKSILIIMVFALALTTIFSLVAKPKYEINFSLLISQVTTQATTDFKYDNYYALQTKDKIGDHLMSFLKTPEEVAKILKDSNFTTDNFTTYDFRNFFRPYKASVESIGVTFLLDKPDLAKNIVQNVLSDANQNLEKTYTPDKKDTRYEIKVSDPLISLKKPHLVLNLIIVLIVGFIFSSFIAIFKEYIKKPQELIKTYEKI